MPIILVVDDSQVDRRLMGKFLGKDVDWLIQYAENGHQALDQIQDAVPDVVVTDLLMPEMDGIELVTAIRDNYPDLPVILATAHGSETLAVEALDRGAASYVPKNDLADKLLDTVEQVLGMASSGRRCKRLSQCLANHQCTFRLDNDPALISPLVDRVQHTLLEMKLCNPTQRMHVGIALEEALLNALYHGNLEFSAEHWREHRAELRQGVVSDLVKQRQSQAPYDDREISVLSDISPEKARFVIRDQGPGFDTAAVPKRHDPETLQEHGGRGLVLMRNFMDQLAFNEAGNEVTMVMLPAATPDRTETTATVGAGQPSPSQNPGA
jgi:CheY-like chemotaxis protein/anti-sigma regulatory factor (Ser/Thr protein kinase)